MIVYAVICRSKDAGILCDYSSEALTGNAPQVTASLLEHLRDHPAIMKEGDLKTFRHRNDGMSDEDFLSQFLQACTVAINTSDELDAGAVEEYFFHLWHQDEVFYCCLSDDRDPLQQKVNFAYLQALAHDFGGRYSKRRIRNANSYSMDKEFKPMMRSTMHHYNINRVELSRESHVNSLLGKVEDLKNVLGRNMELLLEREQKLETLMDKASQARRDSMVFRKRSVKAKRIMEMKSYKMWFLICLSLMAMFYLIIISNCGFRFQYCRAPSTSSATNSNGNNDDYSNNGGEGGN
ncbi:synaptobrevin [Nitzschia inconspicua]|uniref:Synaptobrevin n=1 Tax=Nitzschia inconspicua TaxID=303405 RepID=A0A9K3LNI2_9STRA|nr:synaptobrevin [Nitzschia inconspicua]